MYSNNYNKYMEQSVNSLTPGEQITLLFRHAAANIAKAIKCIEEGKICDAHNAIVKAQNIYAYLSDSLDMHYEISGSLFTLYEYIQDLLVEANLKKDASALQHALLMTREFCETWEKAEIVTRTL
ncbi:MAG: flagellar export chaperone FliS [Clostridiaceae bacterium]|nr:flagellar export chaperone FliS [Clostridiaceae bacterium]